MYCHSGHGETGVFSTLRSPGKGHDHESIESVLTAPPALELELVDEELEILDVVEVLEE